MTDIDEAFLASREHWQRRVDWESVYVNVVGFCPSRQEGWVINELTRRGLRDAYDHQPALLAEIRRLRALLTQCAEQFGRINQDEAMFDMLREFEKP